MNLILFDPNETVEPLPIDDTRARHILRHLNRERGESFDVGLIDGPRGKAWIEDLRPDALVLGFAWETTVAPAPPVVLGVGMPRPQTARRILREATSLGVGSLHFFEVEKGVASYRDSRLWSTGEYRRHLVEGAEQAFATRLPGVRLHAGLDAFLESLPPGSGRIALDVYEAGGPLSGHPLAEPSAALAIGPERGWSGPERDRLRAAGFALVHLGDRVLRSDTACLCGLTLVLAKLKRL